MRQSWGLGAGGSGLGKSDAKTGGYCGSRSAESATPAWARLARKSRRGGMGLRGHAAEVHLEGGRVLAESLARARPRHRGASRHRDEAVVVVDERSDAVGATT